MGFWKKLFGGPKPAARSRNVQKCVLRYRDGDRFLFVGPNGSKPVVTDPKEALIASEDTLILIASYMPTQSETSQHLDRFLSAGSGVAPADLERQVFFRKIAEQFRESNVAAESQLAGMRAVPLDQAIQECGGR